MADMIQLAEDLKKALGEENVLVNEPMANHTTFKIGGPVEIMVTPNGIMDVINANRIIRKAGLRPRVIGQGSNLLVSDEGLKGVVIKMGEGYAKITVDDSCNITCEAGATNADIAAAAQAAGLTGYEFACGIPGTIGGAAYMNAGAYDQQFANVCTYCTVLQPNGAIATVPMLAMEWGYRHSLLMEADVILLNATIRLEKGDPAEIQALMDELQERRASKQPLDMPSAGSTFKRPEGHFAGQLIEEADLKGYSVGGAQVSEKHSGFIVNTGNATAADVLELIQEVSKIVFTKDGVKLDPEVCMWGFDE